MGFTGNELYFCPRCLARGERVVMEKVVLGCLMCPDCDIQVWDDDYTFKQLIKEEKTRAHKSGGGNKSGGKRKKPNKFVPTGFGLEE